MRTHTNDFKTEIAPLGRQIKGKIYHYFNYEIDTEASDKIITENDSYLILEGYNKDDKEELTDENIYSMKLIKNGELLQSLMKQFNFEAKYGLRIGDVINPHFGLLVNGEYEFLDYGDYIIYSKQYNANNETWDYVCYDLMLYSMIQYNGLNISYPITVKNYINAIANKMGVGFANINDAFTNSEELIYKDLFKGKNKTYRDILDKLSEITASNILINDNNELEVCYPKQVGEISNKTGSNIEITNGEEAELQSFQLEGNTTQETAPAVQSKNLLCIGTIGNTLGLTITKSNNSQLSINGTASATGTISITLINAIQLDSSAYTLSVRVASGNASSNFIVGLPQSTSLKNITMPTNISTKTSSQENGKTFTALTIDVTNMMVFTALTLQIQLEKNSSATDFAPYSYIPPKPSPDRPSELVSVGYENIFNSTIQPTWVGGDTTYTLNDGKLTVSGKWYAGILIDVKANTDYYVNATRNIITSVSSTGNIGIYNASKTFIKTIGLQDGTFNTGNNTQVYVVFYAGAGSSGSCEFSNIIVSKGTQLHSYIPYGKYGIEVKTTGKNWLKYPYINSTETISGVTFSDNGDGSITVNGTSTASNYSIYYFYEGEWVYNKLSFELPAGTYTFKSIGTDKITMHYNFYKSDGTNEYIAIQKSNITKTFNETIRANVRLTVNNGITINNYIIYPQIEKGTTATDYEEYKSNTYLYTLDNPLRSNEDGTIKDLAYIKNGYLYVDRKIGSKILNGSSDESYSRVAVNNVVVFINNAFRDIIYKSATTVNVISNYFKGIADSGGNQENTIRSNNSAQIFITIPSSNSITASTTTFKTWLSTHNTEVQYILADPYTEELGQVGTPETYEGITYIETTDSNEPTMNITYISEFEEIDEEYLKDVNVNFGEKFGQINRVALRDTENKIEYVAQDNISIEKNKLTQINIIDNPITLNGNEDNICQNILNKLNGLYYSINDFTTTGLCYYDFLDIFFVKIKDTRYQCLLLNNEITITQGIEETIFADAKSNSQVEGSNYETNYLTNKDIQTKITQLNDTKVENKSVINSINDSKERAVISTEKIMYIKDFTGTTDANGFLDIELNSDFVVCSATASFNSNDYGFVIPYYDYNNGSPKWKLKIKDKNDVAVANTQIATTIYYFKKERND